MDSSSQPQGQPDHNSERCDAVMPSLQVLRGNPGISESVNSLLASYQGQVHFQLAQGKQHPAKRPGRFNAHDSVTAAPHLHWPNEGCHSQMGRRGSYMIISPYPMDCWAVKQYLCNLRSDFIKTSTTPGHTRNERCCVSPMVYCEGCMGLLYA